MTIDEAIKTLRECEISYIQGNRFPNISKEEREHNTKCAEEYGELANWLKDLKWYYSQNLIQRESARRAYHDVIGTMWYTSSNTVDEMIDKLPKAEPPKE